MARGDITIAAMVGDGAATLALNALVYGVLLGGVLALASWSPARSRPHGDALWPRPVPGRPDHAVSPHEHPAIDAPTRNVRPRCDRPRGHTLALRSRAGHRPSSGPSSAAGLRPACTRRTSARSTCSLERWGRASIRTCRSDPGASGTRTPTGFLRQAQPDTTPRRPPDCSGCRWRSRSVHPGR